MNDANDPLEAELAALRPQDVSPELRRRVAERLADPPPARSRRLWRIVVAAGLMAACHAGALLLIRGGCRTVEIPVPPAPPVVTDDDSLPTFLVYRRALAGSPDELDALLDRHAGRASRPDPQEEPVYAYPRSDVQIRFLTGEP
jgi:hypothetical protein